ncbi:lipopolysaccharide biosynthesis protein [Sphingobium amiense]|uniref:Lipopolysaccharide biosynthesis protein n=1 Tax=Sphingobium amiense TaxID=135719 RepID=A0A494W447_9SPHN|nr:lipopolysaccharide biosynthesis protein [Sphingobium amiense]BBD97367.1 lipopolysaccharide biosynthesis protein [Sphingobium amiense]
MNMHGIIKPDFTEGKTKVSLLGHTVQWLRLHYMFIFVVLLPTSLTTAYLFGIASDQYSSEAHFLVRSTEAASAPAIGGGIGQIISMAGGATSSQSEAMSVADYLSSHDAVRALAQQDRLVERFSVPEADYFSRLSPSTITPENLLKYYQRMVGVQFSSETGITTLTVRSFRPQDSYELVKKLLKLGEARVNELNRRSYNDSIALAKQQLSMAEKNLSDIQLQMMHFRQSSGDIDPTMTGQAQIALVRSLAERLAAARAQLNFMRSAISPSSPQYRAMMATVRALEGQVAAESAKLTGTRDAIATDMGGYEKLKLEQGFLAKRYEAAASSLAMAREQARRQQLYIVHVVEPNVPVKSLYPERWRITLTVLIGTLLLYSIGWLIAAGVREHAA